MKAKLKSNKFIIFVLIFICIIFVCSPKIYANSCLNALSVWAVSVLPTLLPFFILTRLIVSLSSPKPNKMDKFFKKIYHTNNSAWVYFLSVLSGYPMGAKLICNMYELGRIERDDARKMFSFCSVSGPMFIVGTVGVSFLFSFKAGLIILIANILASLINGLFYRGKSGKNIEFRQNKQRNNNVLYDCVYDAMISVLMVGAFIVFSFLIIDLLANLKVFDGLTNIVSFLFHLDNKAAISATLKGFVEMTRGILDLGKTNISLSFKTIIASGLVGFGGVSVIMQSIGFLARINLPIKTMILQKFSQAVCCVIITIPLALLFL